MLTVYISGAIFAVCFLLLMATLTFENVNMSEDSYAVKITLLTGTGLFSLLFLLFSSTTIH